MKSRCQAFAQWKQIKAKEIQHGHTKENHRKHSYEYDFQEILCITRTWIITAREKSLFLSLIIVAVLTRNLVRWQLENWYNKLAVLRHTKVNLYFGCENVWKIKARKNVKNLFVSSEQGARITQRLDYRARSSVIWRRWSERKTRKMENWSEKNGHVYNLKRRWKCTRFHVRTHT